MGNTLNITSASFLLFVSAILAVFHLLPRRLKPAWLLAASFFFCLTWAWQFAAVLLLSIGLNYGLARLQPAGKAGSRPLLFVAVGINLLTLVFFRTVDFYLPALRDLFLALGWPVSEGLQLLLPIGLSYYILQAIAYQVDVYRGQTPAESDFIAFALYLAYFPKLIAGPIERAQTFLPQIVAPHPLDNGRLGRSFTLIFTGLARKLIVADSLRAALPWDLFVAPETFFAVELWGWLFVFAFYLYNDFAGYTAMVRGVSGLFGIDLSPNFQQPFLARNFTEFWNRWHISLSHWLRDYIYMPLTRALLRRNRNRYHPLNWFAPPLVTMLVSGLWHGLSWHMFAWGALHGLYQAVERLFSWRRPVVPPQRRPLWYQVAAAGVVFVLVSLAWVPFQVELPAALGFWGQLFTWGPVALKYRRIFLIMPFLVGVIAFDWLDFRRQDELFFTRWPRPVRAAAMAVVILLVLILTQEGPGSPFIYQGF